MDRRICILCGDPFGCSKYVGYFLCPTCYSQQYVPRKDEYTLQQFRDGIEDIKEEVYGDSNRILFG